MLIFRGVISRGGRFCFWHPWYFHVSYIIYHPSKIYQHRGGPTPFSFQGHVKIYDIYIYIYLYTDCV